MEGCARRLEQRCSPIDDDDDDPVGIEDLNMRYYLKKKLLYYPDTKSVPMPMR
jgi:hypothetical protein